MKSMIQRAFASSEGLYTVEGAFTIVIFTVLIMMLLSMMTVVQTEMEVQNALDQVTMELSEYSYLVGDEVEVLSEETTTLKTILQDVKRELLSNTLGVKACNIMIKDLLDDRKLRQVADGIEGIDLEGTSILGDGRTLKLEAKYKIQVDMFGFVDKKLQITQKSQTMAWLPYYAETLSSVPTGNKDSIWNDTNFARGQFFASEQKALFRENEVKSGQGIDLYFDDIGKVVEIYSINVFNDTYSKASNNPNDPNSYKLNDEEVLDQLNEYIRALKKDIKSCDGIIIMESGSEEKLMVNYKGLILVVPQEVQEGKTLNSDLISLCKAASEKNNVEIKIVYSEEAL